jgi:hypothetical protein
MKPTDDPPCESCGEPVSEFEDCGNERPDGTWEFLCPDCYEPLEQSSPNRLKKAQESK